MIIIHEFHRDASLEQNFRAAVTLFIVAAAEGSVKRQYGEN